MEEEPLVQLKKTNRRGPGKKQKLEIDVSKSLKETFLQSKALSGALKASPDLFLLGGGFYLGYVMNMRPGIDVPLIPGGFVGFPDFGGKIKQLQTQVDAAENEVAKEEAGLVTDVEACVQAANDAFDQHRDTLRLGAAVAACNAMTAVSEGLIANLAALRQELLKHKIAQGVLMSTLIYAFTRPGFLQGIGEIIPG